MSMKISAVKSSDYEYIHWVAQKVMEAYDGKGFFWNHPVDPELWKLNSGRRAGVVGVNVKGRKCCVKLFYDDRYRAMIRNLAGFSKARQALHHAMKLKTCQIGCPNMVGLVAVKPMGPIILVSELCDYAMRTDHYVVQRGINMKMVLRFAEFIRDMHDAGISHIDLSLRNTMIRCVEGEQRDYAFLLLDHEDVRFGRKVAHRRRLKNLHHMNERALKIVPLKWRLRFLRTYLRSKSIKGWVAELNGMILRYPSKYRDTK